MELVSPHVPAPEHFVEISAVARIRDGIAYARNFGEPVQVVSQAGYGKTTALHYLAMEMNGVYCHVGQSQKSVPNMYRMLLAALGASRKTNNARDLYTALIDYLRPSYWELENKPRRLLIVDEVQTLEPTVQRELLNIQETCNLALIISGNGERLAKLSSDAWRQIDSRIGMSIKLPPLNRKDCALIGAAHGVEGMDAYEALANFGTRTTARDLGRLLREAKALTTGTGGIHLQHIQNVLKAKGKLADLKLLKSDAA